MIGSPVTVKKMKEVEYRVDTMLGVLAEKIIGTLSLLKNFMKSSMEKFTNQQQAEEDTYAV